MNDNNKTTQTAFLLTESLDGFEEDDSSDSEDKLSFKFKLFFLFAIDFFGMIMSFFVNADLKAD